MNQHFTTILWVLALALPLTESAVSEPSPITEETATTENTEPEDKGMYIFNFSFLPLEERMSRMKQCLQSLSGKEFLLVVSKCMSAGGLEGWLPGDRLSFLIAVLSKEDADWTEGRYDIDNHKLYSFMRMTSGVVESLSSERRQLLLAQGAGTGYEKIKLYQPAWRERLLVALNAELASLSSEIKPTPSLSPGAAQETNNQESTTAARGGSTAHPKATMPEEPEAITPTQYLLWTLTVFVVVGATALFIKRKSE